MRFIKNKNGAISVFLVLILVPCLLIAGVTTDAARIYSSKIVISDAGDMALNAGLSQYEETLHDKYGFLVMEKTPSSRKAELQSYYVQSLNGTGLGGDYDEILHLVSNSFETVDIEASKLIKSPVEKQQIVEYMKYRAPVCLTELVIDKFAQIKDTKKITEAMKKQVTFAESMAECQDSIEQAKEAVDKLNSKYNAFPTEDALNVKLDNLQSGYINDMSKALLMLQAIQQFTQKANGTDIASLAESYINQAKKVKMTDVLDRDSFTAYMTALYYENRIQDLGGIKKLNTATVTESESSEEEGDGDEEASSTDYTELITKYNNAKSSISSYIMKLREKANDVIKQGHDTWNTYYNDARELSSLAKTAYDKLLIVEEDFKRARRAWQEWSDAAGQIESEQQKNEMQKEINTYRDFFDTGVGSQDSDNLEWLIQKTKDDEKHFEELADLLEKEKFFSKSLAIASTSVQYKTFSSQAEIYARQYIINAQEYFPAEETARVEYIKNYEHIENGLSTATPAHPVKDDPFYLKMIEYSKTTEENEEKKEEVNKSVKEGADGADEAVDKATLDGLSFDWSTVSGQLISKGGSDNPNDYSDISGTVKNKKQRQNLIDKYKKSLEEASDFLDSIDKILTKNLENLYVAEYAMQMFSCYTSDKDKDGNTIPADNILSISGYRLDTNPAYKSEIEYIVWGNNSAAQNVSNSIMLMFGIRMLFNAIFAFTDNQIGWLARGAANAISPVAPYLVPIVKVLVQFAFAGVETVNDIGKLKAGKSITILKQELNWATAPHFGNNEEQLGLNYQEFLRIFLNIKMITGQSENVLKRIADCVQINTPNYDIRDGYTMLGVQDSVSTNTTFIGPLSNWAGKDSPESKYQIKYYGVLGY